MSQEHSFKLAFDDFDLSLLGIPNLDRDSDEFATRVSEFFARQFLDFGGMARVVLNRTSREIDVVWTKLPKWQEPKDKVLDLLQGGKLADALPLLWTLVKKDPNDTDNLYHLGVVYSELKEYAKASEVLERLIDIDSEHVHGLTALGVAEIQQGNLLIGEECLGKALKIDPRNRWALRNMGACLSKQQRFDEAVRILRQCLQEAPDDVAAMIGMGEALEALGEVSKADSLYRTAVRTGGPEHVIDIAKDRLTKIAEAKLRSNAGFRPDALSYIKDALSRFEKMTPKQIQDLAVEIAMLGTKGFSINDPSKKYGLKGLEGQFTGLYLVSIMYAAFQQFAPGQDVGIDLSREYAAAVSERHP